MSNHNEIRIAGLRGLAPTTWRFHEFDNFVLARRNSRGWSLQLSTAFRFDCEDEPTPERCESCAREWLADTPIGVFDVGSIGAGDQLIGVAALGPAGEEGRAWYVLRNRQLILGLYRWAQEHQRDSRCADEIEEAEAILRSLQWDEKDAG